jgi:1,4-dihydroxy-2-naphthoyl-CoA hydrolase
VVVEKSEQDSLVERMNATSMGWVKAMNLEFLVANEDEVSVQWTVRESHLQPFGIVHGGVHAGVVETVCSIGAGIAAAKRGHKGAVVGLENHTSFLKAVRAGTQLRGRALPITRGRTTHVWSAEITDSEGKLVARGTVRLLCVDPTAMPGDVSSTLGS